MYAHCKMRSVGLALGVFLGFYVKFQSGCMAKQSEAAALTWLITMSLSLKYSLQKQKDNLPKRKKNLRPISSIIGF